MIKKLYFQQKKRYLKKILGNIAKPRLSIFRSNKHIYAQVINDENAKTLIVSSSLEKIIKFQQINSGKKKTHLVGEFLAQKAKTKKIHVMTLDIAKRKYCGRIKELVHGIQKIGCFFKNK